MVCAGTLASVTGTVATQINEGVSNVTTSLSANLPEFPATAMSANGVFSFNNAPAGVEFELSAKKDGDDINGINTLDLLKLQQHTLSLSKLDNAYKIIAADVNGDKLINIADLVELKKLVLGVITNFPNNDSWRFVDATQTFANFNSPWPLNEVILTKAGSTPKFVAVKIGDINLDASVNSQSVNTTVRSAKAVKFNVQEQTLKAGQTASIAVSAENFNEVFGYQFTTALNGIEIVGVESGAIKVDASDLATVKTGVATMSWMNVEGTTVGANEVLFTLKVRATTNTTLSSAISMTSSVAKAEAYVGSDLATSNATLEVRNGAAAKYELAQNEPNPFKTETSVRFFTPNAGKATFKVYDVTGKVLMNRNIDAAKGENVITLKRSDIQASGVVYYQIKCNNFTASKKMILID